MPSLHRREIIVALSAVFATLCVLSSVSPAQGSFYSLATVHFDVKYQRGIGDSGAQKVADYLQNDYSYLSEKLKLDLRKKLEVRVYDTVGKYLTGTNQKRPWRGGIFWRGVLHLQPVQALVQRELFEQVLSFELAMALLEQTAGRGCPRWLREAFAVYHCGEMVNLAPPIGARLASFSDLDQDLQTYPNPPQREDVHYILGMTMKFFIEKYGEDKAMSVYKVFDGRTSLEDVFKKVFKQEFRTIERTWANYIASLTEEFKRK